MTKSCKLQHFTNQGKINKIFPVFFEYRKIAKLVSNIQWKIFFETGRFDIFNKQINNIESKLFFRYKQVLQHQIVGDLIRFIESKKYDFVNYVYKSSISEEIKIQLFYLNKYNLWYSKEEVKNKYATIPKESIKLALQIWRHILKTNRKPKVNHINLQLDCKVAEITKNNGNSIYDYWIKLSTLEFRKNIYIPLKTNYYFENKIEGKMNNFVEIILKDNKLEFSFSKSKEINTKIYIPEILKISLDVGLNTFIATDKGDLFSRNYKHKLEIFDNWISNHDKNCRKNKQNIKTSKYIKKTIKLKGFIKQEVCRSLNRIIEIYKPKEIIIENLDFNSPNLSRRLNRLIGNFGKRILKQKLESLNKEFGIIITKVNPAYTSQTCSKCGYVDKNNRKTQKDFECKFCKTKIHADVNGSRNILARSSGKAKDIYKSKDQILYSVLKVFLEKQVEKKLCQSRLAKSLFKKNKYFENILEENSVQTDFKGFYEKILENLVNSS